MAIQCHVLKITLAVVVPSVVGSHRADVINIDTDVIVADVLELSILDGVELNGKDMIACITPILSIEEP